MSERTKPNVWEYITYCYGRRLPDSMRDWVRNDLAGKGATVRLMVRMAIPALIILAPFWLIPTTLYVHISMTLPIFIPFVFFSHALNKVWRRHMLAKHGLNPGLVDELSRQKNAHIHQAYIEKYGPRSGPPSSHDI
ncbi:DUF5313 domain-containing protein [Mycolicibacterium smegmatis]|uniref:DUF5313 domain-containing protein n=1 Tax=Mycolicibacterium smegmatis (strain MKD8) TaxID=1214915 RepID=A0A2U9PPJ6_MYCSE|nr:DUF5313 domain-containing protein [Mycolicibacterium smegmatis]AWT53654.1 hypothetical protein D806_026760 [Mycolicibacterium smegmatis MKD8]MCP2621439.1 DUF5313 domain-containing protein [Mycolicibacterium smegmatis]MDF1903469.1 DUF5313 domain-containing protein [Mycolicibacterium smegmatis]MDF1910028.1 DUF5313 domain-containing protein [Mycolicibacterium smegmatis]MDF1921864.1 DUF5313 domain-containing protein [Mycolicibacterium smegmatis]